MSYACCCMHLAVILLKEKVLQSYSLIQALLLTVFLADCYAWQASVRTAACP